jgi:LacI family transcriptional regulator
VTPGRTSIAQDIYTLGEIAAKMLIQQIKGEILRDDHVMIEPSLIVRETTKE